MKFKPQYNNLYDPNKILTDEQTLPIPSLEELQNGMEKPESFDNQKSYEDETHSKSR